VQANAGKRRYAALRLRLMKAWGSLGYVSTLTAAVGEHEEFANTQCRCSWRILLVHHEFLCAGREHLSAYCMYEVSRLVSKIH
jgi:hypothetical protein